MQALFEEKKENFVLFESSTIQAKAC